MLTLALLRHAKSSWDDPALDDFDRPLNERGHAAAPVMGKRLSEAGFVPDLILCSPALRTRQTLDHVLRCLAGTDSPVRFHDSMYLASADELLKTLQQHGGTSKNVLFIGHNPGLHMLATVLAGSGDPMSIAHLAEKFPTAALAILTFDCTAWREIRPATGHLKDFTTPKQLA
jgi:phosphohistidine phosphatase